MGVHKKLLVASLLISLFFLHIAEAAQTAPGGSTTASAQDTEKIDCGAACKERCKASSRPNLCKRACGTCCGRCNCVPPGTYGNYEACDCYAALTTRGGVRKCP